MANQNISYGWLDLTDKLKIDLFASNDIAVVYLYYIKHRFPWFPRSLCVTLPTLCKNKVKLYITEV
jgi:hypothetical protein